MLPLDLSLPFGDLKRDNTSFPLSSSQPPSLLMCVGSVLICVTVAASGLWHRFSSASRLKSSKRRIDRPSSDVYTAYSMWHWESLKHWYSVRNSISRIQHYTRRPSWRISIISTRSHGIKGDIQTKYSLNTGKESWNIECLKEYLSSYIPILPRI